MKRFLSLLLLLICACASAEPAWSPRQIEAPETPLQQALYDLALEQSQILLDNLDAAWTEIILPEHEVGAVSDALFTILEQRDELLAQPKSVLLMLPSAAFGTETAGDFPEEMWSTLGMGLSYQANNGMMESRQAAVLESLSLYDAEVLPAGRGVAHLVCTYGKNLPQIVTAVPLSEDGPSPCKTNLVFHKQIDEVSLYLGMAINLWGENAFECVYIRP